MDKSRLSVVFVFVLLVGIAPGSALAATNSTSTTTSTAAPDRPSSKAVLDSKTVVTDYRIENGSMVIDVRSTSYNVLTITETTNRNGATKVAVRTVDVLEGKSTITVDVFHPKRAAVLITTAESLRHHEATRLAIDNHKSSVISGPWTATDVQTAGLSGFGCLALVTGFRAWRRKRGSGDDLERVA